MQNNAIQCSGAQHNTMKYYKKKERHDNTHTHLK